MKLILKTLMGIFMVLRAVEAAEKLDLDIISYEDFVSGDPAAMQLLEKALYEKGIVGMRGIPGYKEKVEQYIASARAFSALPEKVKDSYAPNKEKGEKFLGYEMGKEKFKRPDGKWVVDDLKVSYYGFVPDSEQNKWPVEVDLKTPFQELGQLMSEVGTAIVEKIGLAGPGTGISIDNFRVGRLLYYRKNSDTSNDNPYWCGAHYDHGVFTALLPAFYFVNGEAVAEPEEAGLYIKPTSDNVFKKVVADDPDVLLFQVGEFGQLATDDAIRATEHRVKKADGNIERYTMALFFNAELESVIQSQSELTSDSRYGGKKGDPCSYRQWHEGSFKRYIVK